MRQTKYNTNKSVERRTCDGIVFDSVMEMRYYRDVIVPLYGSGEIVQYELQKPYTLQPQFKHDGKNVRPIIYVADFYIKYKNGSEMIVDVKGMADSVAKIKRKMMWYTYPDLPYRWVTYIERYGGWIEYEEAESKRKEARKARKEKQNGQEAEQADD